jgi:hypothetical protein
LLRLLRVDNALGSPARDFIHEPAVVFVHDGRAMPGLTAQSVRLSLLEFARNPPFQNF